jgi:hypothetical protein
LIYLGENANPTDQDLGFISKALDWFGNVSYVTDDYTIRSENGVLVVDRSTRPPTTAPALIPGSAPGLLESLARVHPYVWLGVGGLVLLTIARR